MDLFLIKKHFSYAFVERSLKKYPTVERVNKEIGRFIMVDHKKAKRNPERLISYAIFSLKISNIFSKLKFNF